MARYYTAGVLVFGRIGSDHLIQEFTIQIGLDKPGQVVIWADGDDRRVVQVGRLDWLNRTKLGEKGRIKYCGLGGAFMQVDLESDDAQAVQYLEQHFGSPLIRKDGP